MVFTSSRRNDVTSLVVGAVFVLLGLLWIWSVQAHSPKQLFAIFDHPFLIALCVASAVAAGWLLRRYRGGSVAVPADPSARGSEREPVSAEDDETRTWLVRLGCVASAILLAGLLIGNLAAVIVAVALAEVVIAFVLMALLMPRGL